MTVPLQAVTFLVMAQSLPRVDRSFRPRPFRKVFDGIPRHWLDGKATQTQLINAINLLFPTGERFFVKAVRKFEKQIDDPALLAQMKAFYGQEGRHAHAHERYFESLRAQGYPIDKVIEPIDALLHRIAPRITTPELRLSITVALEHYTAIMAELMFEHPFFARMDPQMRSLLLWHAAEEIEHKAVAFDVLAKVAPGYATRMAGMVVATAFLVPIWAAATVLLLHHDGLDAKRLGGELREVIAQGILQRDIFSRALREYLSPSFHPLDHDNYALAREHLDRIEAELALAKA